MKKIALIGVGKMGISHLAIANQTPDIEVVAICDTSMSFIKAITKNTKHPETRLIDLDNFVFPFT